MLVIQTVCKNVIFISSNGLCFRWICPNGSCPSETAENGVGTVSRSAAQRRAYDLWTRRIIISLWIYVAFSAENRFGLLIVVYICNHIVLVGLEIWKRKKLNTCTCLHEKYGLYAILKYLYSQVTNKKITKSYDS